MGGTTIQQFTTKLIKELNGFYPKNEIRQFSKLMLEHILNVSTTQLLMMNFEMLNEQQLNHLEQMTTKLKQHIPIQYIIGETVFYDLCFKVNPSVLIPRPETEELVDWIIKEQKGKLTKLLDIGTGSGCIALSLKANMPVIEITAWDISIDAIATAKTNAEKLNLDIIFKQVDVLNFRVGTEKFDCIVSNPPYVRELEKEMMESNVVEHEPHTALFVSNNDPLLFYRTIAQIGQQMLQPKGFLYFEINEFLAEDMTEMLSHLGYSNIECRKDINGRNRMMKAVLAN